MSAELRSATVEIVFPQHLNHHGTLFGGEALRMMDSAAFIAATRRARKRMVTVGVEQVGFLEPVRHGEIVEVTAEVAEVRRTSLTVAVEMVAEELETGRRRRCGNGRFAFVSVDAEGRPTPIDGSRSSAEVGRDGD